MTEAINESIICYLDEEEIEYSSKKGLFKDEFKKPVGWYFWQDEMGVPLLDAIIYCPWCRNNMRGH